MPRFDVHQYTVRNSPVCAVLNVQADILEPLATRLVVPLVPRVIAKDEALTRLKPTITINGEPFTLVTTDMATIRTDTLGPVITNIEAQRQTVVDAIDFLLQGF